MKDSSNRSGDLSKADQELRQRASELEWQVSRQEACIREQRIRLSQQQRSRDLEDDSQKVEVMLPCPAPVIIKMLEETGYEIVEL